MRLERLRKATWLFFDAGGVLMDEELTHRAWAETAGAVLGEAGYPASAEQVLQAMHAAAAGGLSDPYRGALALLTGGDDEGLHRQVQARGWPALDEPFRDTQAALEALASAGYRLGLIANQRGAHAAARLEWSGLLDHFEVCLVSGEVGMAKPDPSMFALALQMAGCQPEEALMVGDQIDEDIRPARAMGMGTVRVVRGLYRDASPRVKAEAPECAVASLEEFARLMLGQ